MVAGSELPRPAVYPHQIAFNVLPQVETFKDGDDYTTEERKCMRETRKILGRDDVGVSATCVRVPVYTGHSVSANVQTREPLSPEECRDLLAAAPGLTVIDDPGNALYPTAPDAADATTSWWGRIRRETLPRPLPQPKDRRRQPAQGSGHERGPGGGAAARARAAAGSAGGLALRAASGSGANDMMKVRPAGHCPLCRLGVAIRH